MRKKLTQEEKEDIEFEIKACEVLKQMGYQQKEENGPWTKPVGWWKFSAEFYPGMIRWVTVGFYKNLYSPTPSFQELEIDSMELHDGKNYCYFNNPEWNKTPDLTILDWLKNCEHYWFEEFDKAVETQTAMTLQKTTNYEFK